MEYKGYTIVVAVAGVQASDSWQAIFSIHKPTDKGLQCVHRFDDEKPYTTHEDAENSAYEAARAWIDQKCSVN